MLHSQVSKHREEVFDGRFISRGVWPPNFLGPNTLLLLCGSLKDNLHKTKPHTKQLHPPRDFNDFRWRTPEKTRSAGVLITFGQDYKTCSVCCRTGEFLLHFLMIITFAIVCLAPSSDSQAFLYGSPIGHAGSNQSFIRQKSYGPRHLVLPNYLCRK